MPRINVMEARRTFSKTINRVAFAKERIVLERRGEDVAVLVPVEDLALLEVMEDRIDAEEARRRLADAEDETISYEEVRHELGLD